jgi:hypothetical protein
MAEAAFEDNTSNKFDIPGLLREDEEHLGGRGQARVLT